MKMLVHWFILLTAVTCATALAQQPKADRQRRGFKPGEVTTPPAMTERNPERLKVGDAAPGFKLTDPTGKRTVQLADFQGKRPVVLVFGSLTCPPFRGAVPQLEELYQQYQDRAEFLLVYVREAHPDSTVLVRAEDGAEALQKIPQTENLETRGQHARACALTMSLTFPALVDGVDNAVNRAYAGWPSRLVIVGVDGRVAFDGGPGPRGFQPQGVASWLRENVKPAEAKPEESKR